MRTEQLCFARFARPLVERLGEDFFRQVPKSPGVYLMRGEAERVLYVGQSGNLRLRLGFYKNARPDREPRRLIRLVRDTERIEYELCATHDHARLRENELIRLHRPRFNVSNALSALYPCVYLDPQPFGFRVGITLRPAATGARWVFGAFKQRTGCAKAIVALARLWWAREMLPRTAYDFPLSLSHSCPRKEYILAASGCATPEDLKEFFDGRSTALLERFEILASRSQDSALCSLLEADLSLLQDFFDNLQRHNELRRAASWDGIIPRDRLDDLRILAETAI